MVLPPPPPVPRGACGTPIFAVSFPPRDDTLDHSNGDYPLSRQEQSLRPDADLLAWFIERCQRNLMNHVEAKDFLCVNGIADEQVLAAYRIGIGDPDLLNMLSNAERERLIGIGLVPRKRANTLWNSGVLLPTFMPGDASRPVGLIKIFYGQSKHGFATAPAGLACTSDINDQMRVIIVDTPLLALRLSSAGAKGVVVAEVPEVLPPIYDWLKDREIILASYKQTELANLKKVLAPDVAARAKVAKVHTEIELTNLATLELLGIGHIAKAPVTPELISRIVEYARSQIKNGHGGDLLKECCAEHPEFLEVFQAGYLPLDFGSALPANAKRALRGRIPGHSIVVPALDESGVPVDLLVVRPASVRTPDNPLYKERKGLLAPRAATAYPEVLVTDSFRLAAQFYSCGARNVLILRDGPDAQANALRLVDAGVRQAKIFAWRTEKADAMANALKAVCIAVEIQPVPKKVSAESIAAFRAPVAEHVKLVIADAEKENSEVKHFDYPAKPELVSHDERMLRAKFRSGDALYEIETALDCGTKLEVRAEREGLVHLDRFDLSKAMQRRRYSESVALKTQIPFEAVESHLIHLLDGVRLLQEQLLDPSRKPAPPAESVMSDSERAVAMEALRRADLLDIVAVDLEQLGWTGEDANKRLMYLIATGRRLPFQPPLMPVSAVLLSSSSSGKTFAIETTCALMPPEDVLHVSKLSDSALFYLDRDALRHKLLVVPESDALTREINILLRILISNGGLTRSHVRRDPASGAVRSEMADVKGPVSLMTSTTGTLDDQVLSRCLEIRIDESPAQTKRIVDAQLRLRAKPGHFGDGGKRERIVRRHHCIQRLIVSKPVVIPFASRVEFTACRVQHRRLLEKFLNLVAASALLHQHQRLSGEGCVIASERDFEVAAGLMVEQMSRASEDLSANARDVLGVIKAQRLQSFTLATIKEQRPDWTRHKIYHGLEELARLEVVASSRGRGKARQYALLPDAGGPEAAPIRLLPEGAAGKLLSPEKGADNNFTSVSATG